MFERFEHRTAATLRRPSAISSHCHQHDQRPRQQTTDPVQHQHPVGTVLTTETFGIGLDPLFTQAWVMHQLKGIELTALLILRTHTTEKHSTGCIAIQPFLQLLPRFKRLLMNRHPHNGAIDGCIGPCCMHLSHR